MAVASASSLVLPINPKTLSSSNSRLASPSLFFPSQKFYAGPISVSPLFASPARHFESLPRSSRFVRNVAVSSEYEQDEEEPPSFSPDLKLFVGNLPFSVDSAQLASLFENVGNVEMVIYDKVTGRSRGFGFVTMSTAEEVAAAAQQLNGYELEGRPLRVNSGPPPQRENSSFRGARGGTTYDESNRVYVGNLAWGVDDLALQTLFSEQGKVVEARVVYDRDSGRSRGFGFVTYSSAEEVNSAIESLNGVDLAGRAIRVSVAESRPRRSF
ncbi:hypothetical protein SLEP1_g23375 [Rubroshorea leprosula]|uniref:RRM domain-containing protein n=1 Tax=Rubroshorea leprosula TaxID=152421 RepID=A0AAV5JI95_9ROSI|nr:hypothetical protein SLEP1_g23375 [Rubroshorea leprosula]